MHPPVNFDSVVLDALLNEWLGVQAGHPAGALVVLGPDPQSATGAREVVAVPPPRMLEATRRLAAASDFSPAAAGPQSSQVLWQHLIPLPEQPVVGWRRLWLEQGYQSLVRVAFALR